MYSPRESVIKKKIMTILLRHFVYTFLKSNKLSVRENDVLFQERQTIGVGQRCRKVGGELDSAQDRHDGCGEGRQVGDNKSVPLQHLHPQVQAHRRGNAPRRLQSFRDPLDSRHPRHVWLVRVPRDERPVDQIIRRLRSGLRRQRLQYVPRGEDP